MNRSVALTLTGLAVVLFVIASFLAARALTGAGEERAQVLELLRLQAAGDVEAVLDRLPSCKAEPACARQTAAMVERHEGQGRVEILRYEPSVQVAVMDIRGTGRVAWRIGSGLPIVQCVRVRRAPPISSDRVDLIALSDARSAESPCQ